MMSGIFVGMVLCSVFFGVLTGRMAQVSAAAIGECAKAVELVIKLMGSLCLWAGVMEVAKKSGLTEKLACAFSPVTRRIFRGLSPTGEAMGAIAMNMSANLLGLGNAATPLGIAAMQAMEKEEYTGETASNNMVLFVVLNTASIQLVPTTTAMLRLQAGSVAPMEIITCVWLASLTSLAGGLLCAKVLQKSAGGRHQ